jgi:hypothetical protein
MLEKLSDSRYRPDIKRLQKMAVFDFQSIGYSLNVTNMGWVSGFYIIQTFVKF